MFDIHELSINELEEIIEKAQKLAVEKQQQALFGAYKQFEDIAEQNNCSISDILSAGRKLQIIRQVKYRNPSNADETWTGKGRKPKWLTTAVANGSQLTDFEV